MKIMSIIGLVLVIIYLIWLFIAAASNGHISMEEFAPVGFLFGLYFLAFCIVGVVQRKKN
ncbi:MAG: hypothetical protein V1904_07145 [Bacteroidota bacterium]